jgi:hypothetical protein
MAGKMPRPSGARQMPWATRWCAFIRLMSWPMKLTEPLARLSRPAMARIVVVFPAPLAPMSETISPSSTLSDMFRIAWMRP